MRVYIGQREAHADADLHSQVLKDVFRWLTHFKTRYGHLKEVGPIVKAIEQVELDLNLAESEAEIERKEVAG